MTLDAGGTDAATALDDARPAPRGAAMCVIPRPHRVRKEDTQ
ncbi:MULTISPECIES: hypothetical protein [Demequina]|nr:hypothetical protein [Demequina litorisediminis]